MHRMHLNNSTHMESYYNLTDEHFDGAMLANSERVDYFNAINNRNVKILKTKDYIRLLPLCMYFRKHSCLVRPFNQQIAAYTSSGLIHFWARKFQKSQHNKSERPEPKPMSLDQIVGVITMSMCLIAVSCIVFILELLSPRFDVIKEILDFLMFTPK